jgi:hypothetical protein
MKKILLIFSGLVAFSNQGALAQQTANPYNGNKRFEQLGTDLPTPNSYRTASGAPGKDYFQQRADYDIKVELDDIQRKITGSETITYFNNSPDELRYLWLQLDQNLFKEDAIGNTTKTGGLVRKLVQLNSKI